MPSLKLVEIGPVVLEMKIFKFCKSMLAISYYLVIPFMSPMEKGKALYLNKLESPSIRMLCAKFGYY